MIRYWPWILAALFGFEIFKAAGQTNDVSLTQLPWFETRTAHFNVYSCGAPQDVYKLAARLEQFCETYALLAGTQAVASPPIVVLAFPNHEMLTPFLPLYRGQPANLAGFFQRNDDENLIVLSLPGKNSSAKLEVIFHEYTHLLMRRNDRVWPLWLKEGMAEMYSTFETTGGYSVRIGLPIEHHLQLLARQPLMPLTELFSVTPDSPQYNERSHQGIFYAESWLLTHFLMAGDSPVFRARFAQFTKLLRAGERSDQAFTNALQTSLPQMENELRRYLKRGRFDSVQFSLSADISAPKMLTTRRITPVEINFRLGDELLRIDRMNAAQFYFSKAQKIAPASPLPYEGMGLLAARRGQSAEAERELKEALQRGSTSFLAHYIYARECYRLTADSQEEYAPIKNEEAAEIRGQLKESISLMPDFAPAHELLGFFEMVQGENPLFAEQQLRLAIQLEPENPAYLFSLAQAQFKNLDSNSARRTLELLLLPNIETNIRGQAQEMLRKIDRQNAAR